MNVAVQQGCAVFERFGSVKLKTFGLPFRPWVRYGLRFAKDPAEKTANYEHVRMLRLPSFREPSIASGRND